MKGEEVSKKQNPLHGNMRWVLWILGVPRGMMFWLLVAIKELGDAVLS